MKRFYLDANGCAPALVEARNKVVDLIGCVGNASSSHDHGRLMRAHLDEARQQVALALKAEAKEVVFTSGASESNRWFVDALCRWAIANNKVLRIGVSPFEHPSLLKPLMQAAFNLDLLKLQILGLDQYGELITDGLKDCDVLIITLAHNETGILPRVEECLTGLGPDTLVMSDISQAFSRRDCDLARIDLMSFSGQKMGAFAGVGGLIVRKLAQKLTAPWAGGGQERGLRPGTENVIFIAACGEAARQVERERALHQEFSTLRNYFEAQLGQVLPIKILGEKLKRLPQTSAITFMNVDPDALRIACDMAGLSVGFGAACSGLAPEGSFALKRLGLTLLEEKSTIRFSFTHDTTRAEIDEVIARLCSLLRS